MVRNISDETAVISIQGPHSKMILEQLVLPGALEEMPFSSLREIEIEVGGTPVQCTATSTSLWAIPHRMSHRSSIPPLTQYGPCDILGYSTSCTFGCCSVLASRCSIRSRLST